MSGSGGLGSSLSAPGFKCEVGRTRLSVPALKYSVLEQFFGSFLVCSKACEEVSLLCGFSIWTDKALEIRSRLYV